MCNIIIYIVMGTVQARREPHRLSHSERARTLDRDSAAGSPRAPRAGGAVSPESAPIDPTTPPSDQAPGSPRTSDLARSRDICTTAYSLRSITDRSARTHDSRSTQRQTRLHTRHILYTARGSALAHNTPLFRSERPP